MTIYPHISFFFHLEYILQVCKCHIFSYHQINTTDNEIHTKVSLDLVSQGSYQIYECIILEKMSS